MSHDNTNDNTNEYKEILLKNTEILKGGDEHISEMKEHLIAIDTNANEAMKHLATQSETIEGHITRMENIGDNVGRANSIISRMKMRQVIQSCAIVGICLILIIIIVAIVGVWFYTTYRNSSQNKN